MRIWWQKSILEFRRNSSCIWEVDEIFRKKSEPLWSTRNLNQTTESITLQKTHSKTSRKLLLRLIQKSSSLWLRIKIIESLKESKIVAFFGNFGSTEKQTKEQIIKFFLMKRFPSLIISLETSLKENRPVVFEKCEIQCRGKSTKLALLGLFGYHQYDARVRVNNFSIKLFFLQWSIIPLRPRRN